VVSSQKNKWPLFWCWSSSVPEFKPDVPYSRFAVYAILNHRGDFAAAAHAYRRFLARFRTHGSADDVRLMLASIEWRRLGDAAAARATLAGFAGRELDPQRQANLAALQGELPAEARR
jgi:hypothetical protein